MVERMEAPAAGGGKLFSKTSELEPEGGSLRAQLAAAGEVDPLLAHLGENASDGLRCVLVPRRDARVVLRHQREHPLDNERRDAHHIFRLR